MRDLFDFKFDFMTAASYENLAERHPTVALICPPLPELSLDKNKIFKTILTIIKVTSRNQCLKESQPKVSTTIFLTANSPVVWTTVA